MKVHIKNMGCSNRPVDDISRWFHLYLLVAANGAIDMAEDEDYLADGDYELPDADWTYDRKKNYGEDLIYE